MYRPRGLGREKALHGPGKGIMNLTFWIPGKPVPQGSKTMVNGRMIEANSNLRTWRKTIMWHSRKARSGDPGWPITGPVAITADFHFQRPKSHYGTGKNSGTLKPNAPLYMSGTPDLDKLMRALGDGLKDGGLVQDDSLIVVQHITKTYGDQPGILVTVQQISNRVLKEV